MNERHSERHTCVYKYMHLGDKAVRSRSGDTVRKIVDSRQQSCTHDGMLDMRISLYYTCELRYFNSGLARGDSITTAPTCNNMKEPLEQVTHNTAYTWYGWIQFTYKPRPQPEGGQLCPG